MTDLSKSSFDQLFELIANSNSLQGSQLLKTEIEFTDLTPLTDHASGKNTGITVNSLPNRRYTGSVDVTYNRLDLNGLTQYGNLTIEVAEDFDPEDVIAAINTAYGTNLSSADDITLSDTTNVDFDGDYVTIAAKASSLAWIGEIDLLIKINQTQLSSILTIAVLDGLKWPSLGPVILQGIITAIGDTGNLSVPGFALLGDKLHIIGGQSPGGSLMYNTHRVFDVTTNTFDADLPTLPSYIASSYCAVYNGSIYLFGGKKSATPTGTVDTSAEVLKYTPGSGWSLDAMLPAPRWLMQGIVVGDYAYLNNGATAGGAASAELVRYDFANKTFLTLASPGTGMVRNGMMAYGGKIFLPVRISGAPGFKAYSIADNTWGVNFPIPQNSNYQSTSNFKVFNKGNVGYWFCGTTGIDCMFNISESGELGELIPLANQTPDSFIASTRIAFDDERTFILNEALNSGIHSIT